MKTDPPVLITDKEEFTLPEERSRPIRLIKILLFSASIIPAILVYTLVRNDERFRFFTWILTLWGLFLGQAGADYLYYRFTDYHTDKRDAHTKIFAGWKPLFVGGLLRKEDSLLVGISCLLAALMVGIYFYLERGTAVLWLILAGGVVSVFFTPLMLRGLKEPVIFFDFRPLVYGWSGFRNYRKVPIDHLDDFPSRRIPDYLSRLSERGSVSGGRS